MDLGSDLKQLVKSLSKILMMDFLIMNILTLPETMIDPNITIKWNVARGRQIQNGHDIVGT